MILNIRGPNGSGKTTVARSFIESGHTTTVTLANYLTPKLTPKTVTGELNDRLGVLVIGSYRTNCGGMDTIPTFELSREAIAKAAEGARHVVCEGVLASTVFGSWASFARKMDQANYPFAFAYLDTPLGVCLARIQARNGGKPIKEQLVKDKVKAVSGTRRKAIDAGLQVYDLPYMTADAAALAILVGEGDQYLAR